MLKREAGLSGFAQSVPTEDGERLCALVRDAGAGDERAWAELVERYDRLVRHVVRAHGIDVSTSEDIVQVTWCRLVQNLDRVRQPERLGAWLLGREINKRIDAFARACEDPGLVAEFRTPRPP